VRYASCDIQQNYLLEIKISERFVIESIKLFVFDIDVKSKFRSLNLEGIHFHEDFFSQGQ